ncbi:helix-turn-helix transcriptional regulator [Streptomyces triticirhizae]|uniref:XRE family transcriptional regulator n=1 Tax=Streptomyces triticirhizae TaxID=2483353 RepID=A0A3M2LES5_9ACTN|nr:helix-turn-helix transcriptional regulator [Streptomyces triticirhizae]RMI35972.1 XRE family transcriptional regulator [Streptomyces triticirhizae]
MTATSRRRTELAAFLRTRRARISPADVGMAPGVRRRTPGLRREEVAQLSGVGVTWYTWLEQGRPINASPQVLRAVARTLRLDAAEREHLFRLADVPPQPEVGTAAGIEVVGPSVQLILDALDPLPAVVYNQRFDVLGHNARYAELFSVDSEPSMTGRNVMATMFTVRPELCPVVMREDELRTMVATFRSGYGAHIGEPFWEDFIRELAAVSPEFAAMWASGDVVPPGPRVKHFRHLSGNTLRMRSESLSVHGLPDTRMVVYLPDDEETRLLVEQAGEDRIPAPPGAREPTP